VCTQPNGKFLASYNARFSGPQDMEDVPLHAVQMPSVDEDEDSVNSTYSPVPQSPHDMPLLQNDDEAPAANVHSTPATQNRTSDEAGSGSEDSTSLARVETTRTDEPDPRGATPSYFEAVDLSEDRVAAPTITASPETSPTTSAPTNSTTNRRSTFRLSNLFGNRGGSIRSTDPPPGLPPTSSAGPSHFRGGSGGALSLTSTVSRQSGPSPNGHRPSQSNGSLLSLVRKKSTATLSSNHLNSPSMISLNSISAPLTHTLMRTEFTYPKSGPTPEQLKLISSRDSFARFGVPYGPDAIAYASSSRADLSDPPPEFEASEGQASTSPPRSGSRLRTVDAADDNQEDHESDPEGESVPAQGTNDNSLTVDAPTIQVQATTPSGSHTVPPAVPTAVLQSTAPSPSTEDKTAPVSSTQTSASIPTGSSSRVNDASTPKESTQTVGASSSSDVSGTNTTGTTTDLTNIPSSSSTPPNSSPSEKSPLTPSTPVVTPAIKSLSSKTVTAPSLSKAPPTSFKSPPSADPSNPNYPYPESRAESRASSFRSVQSFATAHESIGGPNEFGAMSSSEDESDSVYHSEYLSGDETERDSDQETVDDGSRPGTPRLGTRHLAEATDATVRPTPT